MANWLLQKTNLEISLNLILAFFKLAKHSISLHEPVHISAALLHSFDEQAFKLPYRSLPAQKRRSKSKLKHEGASSCQHKRQSRLIHFALCGNLKNYATVRNCFNAAGYSVLRHGDTHISAHKATSQKKKKKKKVRRCDCSELF